MPNTFWPDRWLLASAPAPPPGFVHNPAAFVPFSFGPNNCVGKGLALQEMRTVVCALLQRFRVRAREGWDAPSFEREYRDYFTAPRPEVPVVLEVRG